MKKNGLKMGIEISTDSGSVLHPVALKLTSQKSTETSDSMSHVPFKYYTDVIVGLSYHKLTDFKFAEPIEKSFVESAYNTLNPYIELFRKSAPRVQSITKTHLENNLQTENFEKNMYDTWQSIFLKDSVDFSKIQKALDLISDFENHLGSPFLYNFSLQLSSNFQSKLVAFYSFLFHSI